MNNDDLYAAMYAYGREQALALREAAPTMTDTEVMDRDSFIPDWREGVQVANAPVKYSGQVYRVLQAHDSTGNPGWNPAAERALFGLCHTTNPAKARAWVQPLGTSGVYRLGECYKDIAGKVWQQVYDGDNVYDAATLPERWEWVL